MKNFIILIVVLLAQNCCAHEHEQLRRKCQDERNIQSDISQNCYRSLPSIDDLLNEINGTFSRKSGASPDHIKWFSHKLCTIGDRALNCRAYDSQYFEPCVSFHHKLVASEELMLNVSRAVLNYMCKSDGEVFLDLVEDDGAEVLTNLQNCELKNVAFEDPNYRRFKINQAFCESLQETFMCYANVVNDHPNENLRRIVREVYEIIIDGLQC